MTHIEDAMNAVRESFGPDYVPHTNPPIELFTLIWRSDVVAHGHSDGCSCLKDKLATVSPDLEMPSNTAAVMAVMEHLEYQQDLLSIVNRTGDTVSIEEAFAGYDSGEPLTGLEGPLFGGEK